MMNSFPGDSEEVLQALERFTKLKQKEIPRELEDYLCFVAKTGDTIFRWGIIKALLREKLITVIKQFYEQAAIVDLPNYPNVDPFNYDTMKTALLERLDSFGAAPFTIQRISELLTDPRKQYSRIDKFMRAIEKNILVVSTIEPGRPKSVADSSDYSDSLDSMVNGSSNVTGVGSGLGDDLGADIDVDIELESAATTTITASPANGQTAALPSINTLNSAMLAASNGASTNPATAEDLLEHHHNTHHHHHHHPHDQDEEEVTDEDDDEDVVHNHLATDTADVLPAVEVAVAVLEEEPEKSVVGEAKEASEKSVGKKRAEEEDEDEGDEGRGENVKKFKAEEEEHVEETKDSSSVDDIPSGDNLTVVSDAAEKEEASEHLSTSVEEAKDLTVNLAKETEQAEEAKEATELETPAAEGPVDDAVKVAEPIPETSEVIPESAKEESPETSAASLEKDSIVDNTAIPEKDTPSPEEAMDVKPIETVDPMEAETLASETIIAAAIPGSEMEVDASEALTAAITNEDSVSMDEPMED